MRSPLKKTVAGLATTFALALTFAAGAQAQDDIIKADRSNWGIAGYKVIARGEGFSQFEVISSPEHHATISFKSSGKGTVAEVVMARTKETLTMDASDPDRGYFLLDGKVVASWENVNEEECKQEGFDTLQKSPAYLTLAKSLQDENLSAGRSSAKAAAVIIPVLRCVVSLVTWCTGQCNACTAYYSTTPPPPATAPAPACCNNCFSWYCGDF